MMISANKGQSEFTSTQIVRFNDTDAAGIVYFGAFATYFDEGFHDALRTHGIDWDTHRDEDFLLPIVEQNIKFLNPLRAHDKIKVIMYIEKIGNRSFTSAHKVYLQKNSEKILCATGTISRVVVGYQNFKPKNIPKKLRKALEEYHK